MINWGRVKLICLMCGINVYYFCCVIFVSLRSKIVGLCFVDAKVHIVYWEMQIKCYIYIYIKFWLKSAWMTWVHISAVSIIVAVAFPNKHEVLFLLLVLRRHTVGGKLLQKYTERHHGGRVCRTEPQADAHMGKWRMPLCSQLSLWHTTPFSIRDRSYDTVRAAVAVCVCVCVCVCAGKHIRECNLYVSLQIAHQ